MASPKTLLSLGTLLLSLAAGCAAKQAGPKHAQAAPAATPPPVVAVPEPPPAKAAPQHAVAADHALVTEVASAVLNQGGNAADAALAAMLVFGVVQPVSSGLGGGGMALYWDAESASATMLDFRETAPAALDTQAHRAELPSEAKRGIMIGVPGEAAGLDEIHRRWGKLDRRALYHLAADVAQRGFAVSRHLRRALHWQTPWAQKSFPGLFAPGSSLLWTGPQARNEHLARTLRQLGDEGPGSFYRGAIADDVVAAAKAAGSSLEGADLASYEVKIRRPLTVTWGDFQVHTAAPPSGGGLLLAQTLLMHPKSALSELGYGSGAYLHLLAETFRGAIADRIRQIGDPNTTAVDTEALLSPSRLQARRSRISATRTTRAQQAPLKEAGTSQLVVVDGQGNAIAITSSLNHMFGAKVVVRGFALNDQLANFSRTHTIRQFQVSPPANTPTAGARPTASFTPTIVTQNGFVRLALGASGGAKIPTAVAQVLLAHLAFGRDGRSSVHDPRIHTPTGGGLRLDARFDAAVMADLASRGEQLEKDRPDVSAVQLVSVQSRSGSRQLEAVSDARKGGAAVVR